MGVPKFFRYISERYPCLSEKLKEYQIPEFDNLYLDMNGIIHQCSHPNDADASFRISEETIFKNIFHYIEILFCFIKPQKLFFMAVDGVAPRAKINQQRGRRFRAAKDAEIQEAKARAKGHEIPKEARFDSNCITPGTVFMSKLNEQLKYFVTYKISTDKLWQKCKIILSGSQVPGEGEHKIMDYIRYMKAQPNYDGNTRHCLYGLDADLIMLGLCSHEPHFSLLREEVKFGKAQKKILTPEETNFCLLHLSLMREYLELEFSPIRDKIKFKFDVEKIIDDWVLMGFLVGNDFIPHLPNLHIDNGALTTLYKAYMDVLPTLDGYINEAGTLNLARFEKFMEKLADHDIAQFDEIYTDLKYFESKTGKRNRRSNKSSPDEISSPKRSINKDLEALLIATNAELGDEEDDEEEGSEEDLEPDLELEFVQHKRDYYMSKMEYADVDCEIMRSQAEGYIRAIQWNLHYYYNGCCSWSWYYPHHYAPYISDIKNFKNLNLKFDLGEPFLPFEQLLAVLPAASKSLLPEAYHSLMTEESSPIIKYYPINFKTDLNGKRQEWEAVVLIPLINEKSLIAAMAPCNKWLVEDERRRNKHGPMMVFCYTETDQGVYEAPSKGLPAVHNHTKLQLVDRNEILIPEEKLVKGLCKGVKLSVYYPGFPTLQYVDHKSRLHDAKVKVFDQPSRRESMILTVQPKPIASLDDIAKKWLGKTVFICWPHLVEAYVVGVQTSKRKITIPHPNQSNSREKIVPKLETIDEKTSSWNNQKKEITETYKIRLGIELGEIEVLVLACPIIGRQYVYSSQGKMTLEKQWCEVAMSYAYQVVLYDIATHNPEFIQFTSISQVFVPKSICFMLGHPHYGTMGEVTNEGVCLKTGRVKVAMLVCEEPSLEKARQMQIDSKQRYMPGNIAAQRLCISGHLLSRITGTMFVINSEDGNGGNVQKLNIGLNLKFNKKNEEVQGFTRKDTYGSWLYSNKALEFVDKYISEFPELFERIEKNSISSDIFHKNDLFPAGSSLNIEKTVAWIKEQQRALGAQTMQRCGTEELELEVIKQIENEVEKAQSLPTRVSTMQVKPHLLYKPGLNSSKIPPDPKALHRLFDRIVCVRDSFTVPTGTKGTIIGIQKGESAMTNVYEVLFDKPFPGGLVIRNCSENRGYRLTSTDFINISYGLIVESNLTKYKPSTPPVQNCWRQQQPQQIKQGRPQATSMNKVVPNYDLPPDPSIINWRVKDLKIDSKKEQQQPVKLLQRNSAPTKVEKTQSMNHEKFQALFENHDVQKKNGKQTSNLSKKKKNSPQDSPIIITGKPGPKEFQALWVSLTKTAEKNKITMEQNKSVMEQRNISKNKEDLHQNSSTELPCKSQRSVAEKLQSSLTESSPQDPSAFLRAVLKISDDKPKSSNTDPLTTVKTPNTIMSATSSTAAAPASATSTPVMSAAMSAAINALPCQKTQPFPLQPPQLSKTTETYETSPMVQQLFDKVRQAEMKNKKNTWYGSQVLSYYQLIGIGLPRYSYCTNKDNLIISQITLPDGRIFHGDFCRTSPEAAESASKKVYEELQLNKASCDAPMKYANPPQQAQKFVPQQLPQQLQQNQLPQQLAHQQLPQQLQQNQLPQQLAHQQLPQQLQQNQLSQQLQQNQLSQQLLQQLPQQLQQNQLPPQLSQKLPQQLQQNQVPPQLSKQLSQQLQQNQVPQQLAQLPPQLSQQLPQQLQQNQLPQQLAQQLPQQLAQQLPQQLAQQLPQQLPQQLQQNQLSLQFTKQSQQNQLPQKLSQQLPSQPPQHPQPPEPQNWPINRMQRPSGPPAVKPVLPSAFPYIPMMQMPMPMWNVKDQQGPNVAPIVHQNQSSQRNRFPQPPFQHVLQQPLPPMHNQHPHQNQRQFPPHNQQAPLPNQQPTVPQYQQSPRSHQQQSQQQTKKATSFVPLQAQRKTRKQANLVENKETRKSPDDNTEHKQKDNISKEKKQEKSTGTNKLRENINQTNQGQNASKANQKAGGQKQRRSRVAAKFMADPVTNGNERQ